jgi:hypothetical protein
MFSLTGSSFVRGEEQKVLENHNNHEGQAQHTGHTYNIGNNELPNTTEIVKSILESEKLEYQRKMDSGGSLRARFSKKDDSYWQDKEELYLEIEELIRENSDAIPSWQIAGPLNYSMSLEQMKDAITRKFKELVLSGNLMTEEQLTKEHNRENFYPTTGRGGDNLTRIWGAEYLKSNLMDNTTLNATEHFLIVEDSASEIDVQVWHGEYPCVTTVNNAHILSKKIEGVGQAWEYRYSPTLDELKYRDFKDPGNIIRDPNGTGWVVDTEMKSFDSPNLDNNSHQIQDYLKRRFKVLAGKEYLCTHQTFKISVNDLNLKTNS